MACFFSARVKVENPTHDCLNSKIVGREEYVLSNKASSSSVLLTSRTEGEILQSNYLKCFTFNEIKTATRNFRPSTLVGEGAFGCVFKGRIDEHTLAPTKPGTGFDIAVKMFNKEINQGHSEWLAEVNNLGKLRHPNLVKLIGYCLEDHRRICVYEFLAKGSLDYHLFRKNSNFQPLLWKMRMTIALDAAKGLAFLHSEEIQVIHGNFKTSNILIDSNHNAKLSDFGLDKDRSEKNYVIYWGGPKRYTAPEYIETGHHTKKGDVYSFGVVLLEIMSGKPAFDENRPPCERSLVEWAKRILISKHKIFHVMDHRIKGQYSRREAVKVAHIALQCLSRGPDNRPDIDEVVRSLEQLQVSNDIVDGGGSLI